MKGAESVPPSRTCPPLVPPAAGSRFITPLFRTRLLLPPPKLLNGNVELMFITPPARLFSVPLPKLIEEDDAMLRLPELLIVRVRNRVDPNEPMMRLAPGRIFIDPAPSIVPPLQANALVTLMLPIPVKLPKLIR